MGNRKLEITISHASGNVYTILCIWIEVERGDLGWRWRLLAPHCQKNPVQTFQVGSSGLYHPASTYLSISCHFPSRTPAILLLPDYSVLQNMLFSCLECPTMSFPPSSSSFRAQLIRLIFPRPPASHSALHGPTHREHPALYTSVQIPASHTGLTAPVHQDGVWWLCGPIRCPDTEQSSSKF